MPNQCRQYLIMLGRITKQDLLDEAKTYPLTPWFDPDRLPQIDQEQLVWFDEMHVKQKVELIPPNNMQIRFYRGPNGRFDPTSTTLAPPAFRSVFKYTHEARFCLGVAKVRYTDGSIKGLQSKVFNYSGKKIVSIKEWEKRCDDEIKRVKTLNIVRNSPWVKNPRDKKTVDARI